MWLRFRVLAFWSELNAPRPRAMEPEPQPLSPPDPSEPAYGVKDPFAYPLGGLIKKLLLNKCL